MDWTLGLDRKLSDFPVVIFNLYFFRWDLETEKMSVLGTHDATVSCVSFDKETSKYVSKCGHLFI